MQFLITDLPELERLPKSQEFALFKQLIEMELEVREERLKKADISEHLQLRLLAEKSGLLAALQAPARLIQKLQEEAEWKAKQRG
jgi:hypothetical protein